MSRVVHFEILAENLKRAAKFYTDVFGWKIEGWGEERYLLVTTGPNKKPGINGAIMPRIKPFTGKKGFLAAILTVQIDGKLQTYLIRVKRAGGKQITPMQTIPDIGTHAYCRDTEGNVFGILQPPAK